MAVKHNTSVEELHNEMSEPQIPGFELNPMSEITGSLCRENFKVHDTYC